MPTFADILRTAIIADHQGCLEAGALDAFLGTAVAHGLVTWAHINALMAQLQGQCCQ